jgi:hypothetical protein
VLIHRERRYVVVTPPKTGSCTLNRLLIRPPFGAFLSFDYWHHNTAIPSDCDGFRVYLSVRHPLARAASLYRHLARDEWGNAAVHPFAEFCRRVLLTTPHDVFFGRTLCEWADSLNRPIAGVIRLEHVREDLAQIEPDGPFVVPWENADPALRPASFWFAGDPNALPLALQWGRDDLERFGYVPTLPFVR